MKNCISVVIATYNRSQILGQTLESLLRQQVSDAFDYELVVVNNNSKDNTEEVVRSFEERFKGRLKYFFEPISGKPYALNKGIREARGNILAFTDDDVQLDVSWLEALSDCFQTQNCDGVGGRVLPVYPDNTPLWIKENPRQAAGAVVIYDYGEGVQKFNSSSMDYFIGANYAFKRAVFDECGLFRTDLFFGRIPVGEDLEFIERVFKRNKSLYYAGNAVVRHPVDLKRMELKRVAQWHIALGRFAGRMEFESKNHNFVYLGHVPRYILKGIVQDLFLLILNLPNQLAFFKHYRSFFRYFGMIKEYRTIASQQGRVNA